MDEKQKRKLEWATGNDKDWPKMTDDPQVNCEIDHMVDAESPSWDKLPQEQKDVYIEEVRDMKFHVRRAFYLQETLRLS